MKTYVNLRSLIIIITLFFVPGNYLSAHCDSIDGPVVKAFVKALETGNVNYALIWVQSENEDEVRKLFDKVMKVRGLNQDAKELADMYFFEAVVRIHRMGEGESYTGLKPAGYNLPEGIRLADHAVESSSLDELLSHAPDEHQDKLTELFDDLISKSNFDINNVDAGRDYVASYVHFIHFVEHIFDHEHETMQKHHH